MTPQALPVTSSETSAPPAHGWPVLRLGFRPFYLAAALFAGLAVPLWIAQFLGPVTLHLTVAPVLGHAHEMLFGFAAAVIIGFLLTAGKAWTGLATPRGPLLGALVTVVGRRSRRRIGGDAGLAATAWFTAFAIYLFVFAPWLLQPRFDGKDG